MKLKTHLASALAVSPFIAYCEPHVRFLLMGAAFPDIDLLFKEKQHRLSLFHSIEIPFIGLLLFLLVPVRYGYLAACFCAGWVVHLMGDMIQGGVRSLFLKRKVGFKKFYWDRYYNTSLGIFIDLFLLFLGFVGTFKVASEWDIAVLIPVFVAFFFGSAQKVFFALVGLTAIFLWLPVAI